MSNRLRRWVFRVAIWTIAIFGIGLLVQQSKAFTNCIHDRKNSKEYKSLHERNGITPRNPRQTRPARSRDRQVGPDRAGAWRGAPRRHRWARRRRLGHRRRAERDRPGRSRDPRAEALPKERPNANLNTATFDRQGVLWF